MKAIWTIVGALAAMMILSLVMVFVTMPHTLALEKRNLAGPGPSIRCNCSDRCRRRGVK